MSGQQTQSLPQERLDFVDVPLGPEEPKKEGLKWMSTGNVGKIAAIASVGVLLIAGVCVGIAMTVGGVNKAENQNPSPTKTRHSEINPIVRIAEHINKLMTDKKVENIPQHEPEIIPVKYTKEHDSKHDFDTEKKEKLEKMIKEKIAEYEISKEKKKSVEQIKQNNPEQVLKKSIQVELKKVEEHDRGHVTRVENQKVDTKHINPKMKPIQSKLKPKAAICETPECAEAAANLVESMDLSVDPCDDFFSFACGGWVQKHPIPESGSVGTFNQAQDLMDKRLGLLLSTPAAGSDPEPLHMIRRNYNGCMDTDTMDQLGTTPLLSHLGHMGGYPLIDQSWMEENFDLNVALREIMSINIYPLLGVGIDADIFNTSRKTLYAGQGSVGPLGYYIMSHPDDYPDLIDAYKTYIVDTGRQLRDDTEATDITDEMISKDADDIIMFESEIAKIIQVGQSDEELYYLTDVAGLQGFTDAETAGMVDWLGYFKLMFTSTDITIENTEPVYATEREYVKDLSTVLSKFDTRTLANYLAWYYVMDIGQETTYDMRNITFNFEKAVYGIKEFIPRDYYCVLETSIDLSFPTSRAYVDEFFPASAKTENEQMVADLRDSFKVILEENTWMKPEDQAVAEEKLAAIESFVAYPDWIVNDNDLSAGYEGLVIDEKEQFQNLVRIGEFLEHWTFALFRDPPESVFVMPPTVVNAFYNPLANSITILAGILQAPFYAHNTLAALNYGGIGMVIGHEMTHGFDNSGRLFDKDGNMIPWWSDDTINAFEDRAQCFVDQYNGFTPPELIEAGINQTVDGQQTLGENIADNGGIREAFRAYQIYVDRNGEESRLPGLDEFTPNHLFYLGFANVWCEAKTAQVVLNQLATDPHSPGRFRILGPLSNDESFSKTWNCPAGSPMNRGDERCLLW